MQSSQSILITGGTGSFGRAFVRILLECHPDIKRLVIFWRDDLKQFEMLQTFAPAAYPRLPYSIGRWGLNSFQSQTRVTLAAEVRVAVLGLVERVEVGGYDDSTVYACHLRQPCTRRERP